MTKCVDCRNPYEACSGDAHKNPAAVALGTLGGKVKSQKKTTSSRENGKLGGRPVLEKIKCLGCSRWRANSKWGRCKKCIAWDETNPPEKGDQ